MNSDYLHLRHTNVLSRYKLSRRCELVCSAAAKYLPNPQEPCRVLDVGACDGNMLKLLAGCLPGISAELFGVEPNEKFIRVNSDARVKLYQGSGENLRFNNNHFKLVINSLALEHIENAEKSLDEVYRVLENNGMFILITVVPLYHKMTVLSGLKRDEHYKDYSRKDAVSLLEAHGFEVVESKALWFPLFYAVTVARKREGASI